MKPQVKQINRRQSKGQTLNKKSPKKFDILNKTIKLINSWTSESLFKNWREIKLFTKYRQSICWLKRNQNKFETTNFKPIELLTTWCLYQKTFDCGHYYCLLLPFSFILGSVVCSIVFTSKDILLIEHRCVFDKTISMVFLHFAFENFQVRKLLETPNSFDWLIGCWLKFQTI